MDDKAEAPAPRVRLTSCTDERNIEWFFEMNSPLWYLFCSSLIIYSMLLAYMPYLIPFENIGVIGQYSRDLTENYQIFVILGFWALLLIHFLEAIYVVNTANQFYLSPTCLNLWFFQTLIVGYPSTRIMMNYAKLQKLD